MKYTIHKMNQVLRYQDENKKWISLNGYAFMDECERCFIIVYGEGRRDSMAKYLSGPTDELKIKYQYVNLLS